MTRSSRFIVTGFALAFLVACSPDGTAPVGPRPASPRFQRDIAGTCDTVATIAVNDWSVQLRPGLVPLAPGIIDGQVLFQGTQVMFGGGVLYGTSTSDIVAGYHTNTTASDLGQGPICTDQKDGYVHTVAQVSVDSGVVGPAGLGVTQESFAWAGAPDNGYVLLKYTFSNTGHQTLSHFYSGWLADWDVLFDGSPFDDLVHYNAHLGIGEVSEFDTLTYPAMLGIVPVGPSGVASFEGYRNAADRFTSMDYFGFLSGGINAAATADADIREEMGLGAVDLLPMQSTVAYFALVGGANRADFEANVAAARAKALQLGFCGIPAHSGLKQMPTVRCTQ